MIRKYGPDDSLPTMYKVLAGQCPVPQTLIRPISYGADPDLAFLKYLKDAIPPTQFEKIKKMIQEIEMYKGKNREKILDLILKLLEEYRYRHFTKKQKIKYGKIKYKKLE
jgi:O6-methylguanine-DNA--protein-cysteine methyltransferase